MTLDERPFETLLSLAERRATGELICASARAEVHVFLQGGRIAWATDSVHPFAFTRYLQRTAQLDADAFRDILESCRRERRPLGETLVSWGVATPEEVRDALRHQLELALEVLCTAERPVQTLFLDRTEQFSKYDASLTFAVGELAAARVAAESRCDQARRASSPPAPGRPATDARSHARRLVDTVDGSLWAELLDVTTVIDAAPGPSPRGRCCEAVVAHTVLDGAELAALQSPAGTLAGVSVGGNVSLWCRLVPDAAMGSAISALSAFAPEGRAASGPPAGVAASEPSWELGGGAGAAVRQLRDFLGRAPETLATVVTELDGEPWVCGMGVATLPPEWALDLVRRRKGALTVASVFDDGATGPSSDAGVGFSFRALLTREPRVWCFGAELGTNPRRTLWLLLDRGSAPGLGWAYLTSLSRQLLRIRNWERHG